MNFRLTVNITFYLLLLGAITAFPAPVENEGKAALDSDSVTKIEESLSETTTEPVTNKEETSQVSSVEQPKDASSEEHQSENQNANSKKPEQESKTNDKSTNDVTERTSKKHSTVKPKSKPAVVDKEKKSKHVGAADKGHRGKVTKAPHQKGGRLAVSSTKHKHDPIPIDDSSSYEEHKKQKYLQRKSTSGSSHQKQTLATVASPEIMIMLDKISKQQMELEELLKQMGMRQANMEGSIYHIARNFPVGNSDY